MTAIFYDSVLSQIGLLFLPFWWIGVRKVRQTMNARCTPLIAWLAAFAFVSWER